MNTYVFRKGVKMTINLLTELYKKWTDKNNLPYIDADDLHYDLCDDYSKNKRYQLTHALILSF